MGQGRVCTMETKAFLVHPSHQGVCGRHGTEDDDVTHGDLVMSEKSALGGRVGKESRREWSRGHPFQRKRGNFSNGCYKETPKCIPDAWREVGELYIT